MLWKNSTGEGWLGQVVYVCEGTELGSNILVAFLQKKSKRYEKFLKNFDNLIHIESNFVSKPG